VRRGPVRAGTVIALCVSALSGCTTPGVPILSRPLRRPDAITGSAFIQQVRGLDARAREERTGAELIRGNMPDFLRRLVPIAVSNGRHAGWFYVTPDYLSIGSDTDFVRMPMNPMTAQRVADALECVFPTRKMVDDIYAQAAVKLEPSPFSPKEYDITSADVFWQSHLRIERQRTGRPLGLLVAGVKKDVVVTPLLADHPGKLAIYGWHRLDGKAIQPLYVGHTATWVDYSHCIRLVGGWMDVDGAPMRVVDVAKSPELSGLISDEGAFDWPRY
jgi:hypothetical protein